MIGAVDADAWKEQQRAFYGEGDYGWISRWLMPAAEELVAVVDVQPGDRVLDVAAGDGNVAVAAGHRGAAVTAVDLSPHQVELGRARTESDELDVTWTVGDAEALPVEDGAFDHVLSAFGVMYAPRPEVATSELFRAVAAGGTVGVVAWPPGGFNDRVYALAEHYLKPDGGAGADEVDPEAWGDEAVVRRRLARREAFVEVSEGTVGRLATSPRALWREAAANVPVLVAMRSRLSPEQFESFGEAYARLVAECARPHDAGICLEVRYTLTAARLPATA